MTDLTDGKDLLCVAGMPYMAAGNECVHAQQSLLNRKGLQSLQHVMSVCCSCLFRINSLGPRSLLTIH